MLIKKHQSLFIISFMLAIVIKMHGGVNTKLSLPNDAIITFDSLVIDYDTINEYEVFVGEIPFKNTGNRQLIIANCKTSCGCLVAECPSQPIAPSESGIVKFRFDPTGKQGKSIKNITLTSNAVTSNVVITLRFYIAK